LELVLTKETALLPSQQARVDPIERSSMTDPASEIKSIFEGYVFGFIKADIGREIYLARLADEDKVAGREFAGGGNVLAALGLTCYSEYLGSFLTGDKDEPMQNWQAWVSGTRK
jgi:hypothetical protein